MSDTGSELEPDEDLDDYRHPQILVEAGGQRAYVDHELAPLLRELWRAGIDTYSSCQDLGESVEDLLEAMPHLGPYVDFHSGRAVIDFSPPDAQRFLNLVAGATPPPALYDRMARWTAEGAWRVDLIVLDAPAAPDRHDFRIFGTQVQFPRYDIPGVIACLRRHNERLASGSHPLARGSSADWSYTG
jgi:hypothetical protein